ncbi:MAG: hypothetical protein ACRELY_07870 [Polyangiaceae bacterium]
MPPLASLRSALGDFAVRLLMPASTIGAGVLADDQTLSHGSDDIQLWTFLGIYAGVWTMAAAVAVDATIEARFCESAMRD